MEHMINFIFTPEIFNYIIYLQETFAHAVESEPTNCGNASRKSADATGHGQ